MKEKLTAGGNGNIINIEDFKANHQNTVINRQRIYKEITWMNNRINIE